MSDTIEVKLPVSGSTVTIRNYTTRADDNASKSELYRNVEASNGVGSDLKLPIANAIASQEAYIYRLVEKINGESTDIRDAIDSLRTEDSEFLAEKVAEIVEAHSPKAPAATKPTTSS